MTGDLFLRNVENGDLPHFFEHQQDPIANEMAAFTAKDPANREAFNARWNKILVDPAVTIKTIVFEGQVAGHALSYEECGKPEVSYWIGRSFWGRGIATWALSTFLEQVDQRRPIYARVAKDNIASRRVLGKCGFVITGEARGFANARGEEIEELVLELGAKGDIRHKRPGK